MINNYEREILDRFIKFEPERQKKEIRNYLAKSRRGFLRISLFFQLHKILRAKLRGLVKETGEKSDV